MTDDSAVISSPVGSRRQQSVQTDDLRNEMEGNRSSASCSASTNFSYALLPFLHAPTSSLPHSITRKTAQSSHHPKAKLIVTYSSKDSDGRSVDHPCLIVDKVEKQIGLVRQSNESSPTSGGISNAPKKFPFDGAFSDQDQLVDFCTAVLNDQISSVVNGNDGCVIYLNCTGKREVSRLVGKDDSVEHLGFIPTTINWLFAALTDQRSTQFYITISATGVQHSGNRSIDLLYELQNSVDPEGRRVAELKPGGLFWKKPFSSSQENEPVELLATNVTQAAHYLDVAFSASKSLNDFKTFSHIFFTLNVYRSLSIPANATTDKVEQCQLNLIELMILPEKRGVEDDSSNSAPILDFILNLISGRCSPPFGTREPVLHSLLRNALLSDDLFKLSLVLHTSVDPTFYATNLEILRQISKFQHIWKRRSHSRYLYSSSHRRKNSADNPIQTTLVTNGINLSGIRLRRLGKRTQRRRLGRDKGGFAQGCDDANGSGSDLEYTSSSEQSCTTVIYLGRSHPLRKLNATDRIKRLTTVEKKDAKLAFSSKSEEKPEATQVRSPPLSHHRRFKGRSGHKGHSSSTITNELWVDGPKANTNDEQLGHLGSPNRGRSGSTNDRQLSKAAHTQTSAEKGLPDGRAFDKRENLERKLEFRMRKINWSNESPCNTKIAKQLEALLTPRSDRKITRGDSLHDSSKRQHPQQKQMDQIQQTAVTSDFPPMTNGKYDSFPAVTTAGANVTPVGANPAAMASRGVKPFVKEWVQQQNRAIASHYTEQPPSPQHKIKVTREIGKADGIETPEIPQVSRMHRNHSEMKQSEAEVILNTPIDSAFNTRSLPRQITPEVLWTTQHHLPGSTVDNLSRVARWVESVSTSKENPPPVLPKGCFKHPHQRSPLCKSFNKSIPTASSTPKSPELSRGSSAPAARFRTQHGGMVIQSIEEIQTQTNAKAPPTDPRKPDGASDPGLHIDRSFGSVTGLNTITEGMKSSPLRKPVFKRFADLFVCSPSSNRGRQQQHSPQKQPQPPVTEALNKMCTPFFGGGAAAAAGSSREECELSPSGDLLSIDSAGMLFTSLSKATGGGSSGGNEESLFLESEKLTRSRASGNQPNTDKLCEEGLPSRLKIKEAGTKHRFGFLQSPLFSKRTTSRLGSTSLTVPQTQATNSAIRQFHTSSPQKDSMAFHCQVVLEKPPHPIAHCHHKCVSQSSSSGLGSEHSEQHSLRCHCSIAQSSNRLRRCRMRPHRMRNLTVASPEVECEAPPLMTVKYPSAGGHASSGYESVLRDDSELSSQSSSGGSYPWPPSGAKEAACQTTPCDFASSVAAIVTQTSQVIPEALTGSFTDTVTVSATGDTMLASVTSRTSGGPTLSTSTSKRSLSAPPGSSGESRSGSLPSVRRVSPQRLPVPAEFADPPSEVANPEKRLDRTALTRNYSDVVEPMKAFFRHRKIVALLQRQEKLKAELTDAKARLLADPGSWSFDLNVAEHMDPNDEGYLEALKDETELLQQRVDACRSHAEYLAYFQSPPPPSAGSSEAPR